MLNLTATKRDLSHNLEIIRQEGFLPAVFYGRKEASTPISIKETDFMKVWKQAGESSIVTLECAGESHDSLIHDVSVDPVKGNVVHVDFYVIEKGKKVTVDVPLTFVGVAPAQKDLGGSLVKVMHELPIEAEAKNLPHEIEVDVSVLTGFESRIFARDLKLPTGVVLAGNPDEIVALVNVVQEEKVEEAAPVDLSSIELSDAKGKKEEEGAEEAKA